ncbi:MAG: hypothetical protein LIO91_01170 [Bacteroidales bacterium]|nr:hypothetical protein [Bacteroidales bacterium]
MTMFEEEYDNDFGMTNEEYLYRVMNPEDPMYMGSEDAYEDIDPDDFDDWD